MHHGTLLAILQLCAKCTRQCRKVVCEIPHKSSIKTQNPYCPPSKSSLYGRGIMNSELLLKLLGYVAYASSLFLDNLCRNNSMKSREVCIKTRSPPASPPMQGQLLLGYTPFLTKHLRSHRHDRSCSKPWNKLKERVAIKLKAKDR